MKKILIILLQLILVSGAISFLRFRASNSNAVITPGQIFAWDEKIFELVKKYKLPPTTASKVYAYLAVAQSDFARHSYSAKGAYVGNIDSVSWRVVCEFFKDDCQTPETDRFSEKISNIVSGRIMGRILTEYTGLSAIKVKNGDEYWYGKNPVTPQAGSWKTWTIKSPNDFLAPPPPAYESPEDLSQIAAVKYAVQHITPDQKTAVNYWAGSAGTVTPAGIWLRLADKEAANRDTSLAELLRMRQTLTMAIADSFISCWNAKFTYWTKRPNMRDAGIVTIIPTPNFPGYPSGHSTISAAAAVVLNHFFPDPKWLIMAKEAKDSRLWAGIHFPVDNDQGFAVGLAIGQSALATLTPDR